MKKRNYVVAISMIALLIQSGGMCAMEGQGGGRFARAGRWIQQKGAAVKGATLDSLYKRAKDFVKEMKTLKRCHKDKSCTPAQYQKIKQLGWGIATAAAAVVAAAALVGTAAGVRRYRMSPEQLVSRAKAKFGAGIEATVEDRGLLEAVATGKNMEARITDPQLGHVYSLNAIKAAGFIVEQRLGKNTNAYAYIENLLASHLRKPLPYPYMVEAVKGEGGGVVDLP